jgi:hypothetical protein
LFTWLCCTECSRRRRRGGAVPDEVPDGGRYDGIYDGVTTHARPATGPHAPSPRFARGKSNID